MSPSLALILLLVLLMGLLRYDPANAHGTSLALWVPLIWMFIEASRLPSQWLSGQVGQAVQALEEGNPLDRMIYSVLILLAIVILISRSFNWGVFFTHNRVLLSFLLFALASVLWSDFPFIAVKRWVRDVGCYLMVLVVLSDPRPLEAIQTLLRRLCYLVVPLSILLIKYYPQLGRHYSFWTGAVEYVGVGTSKNMLGSLCFVTCLFFFWDTITRWSNRKQSQSRGIILVNFAFMAMALWLLNLSDSATSRSCLMLGCLTIAAAHTKMVRRHLALLKVAIPVATCIYLMLVFGFGIDINAGIAEVLGRDPTLTGRTEIWKNLLGMHTNPFLGTGYESFWLGSRLAWVWQQSGGINEAHNGYLDIYLNLGLIGLLLLLGFLTASYHTICKKLDASSALGSLGLAMWITMLFYNVSEAAFKSGLMWAILLLGALVLPDAEPVNTACLAEESLYEELPHGWGESWPYDLEGHSCVSDGIATSSRPSRKAL